MSIPIYASLLAGIAIGLVSKKKLKKCASMGLSVLVYGLVFMVGLNSGRIAFSVTSDSYGTPLLLRAAIRVVPLSIVPALASLLIAKTLLGGRDE